MTTQTAQPAQNYPQSNNGFKLLLFFIAGILAILAIQNHWIIDFFTYCLSLIFDNFSVKVSGFIPDLIILILFALVAMGVWHILQFYLAATVIVLAIAIIAGVMFSDDPAKHTNGLKMLSAMEKGE